MNTPRRQIKTVWSDIISINLRLSRLRRDALKNNEHVIATTDNTYDIGSDAIRYRNLYLAGDADLTGDFNVDGATTLDQVTINTTDGNFTVSGPNNISISTTKNTDTAVNIVATDGGITLTGATFITDPATPSKRVTWDLSDATAEKTLTLVSSHTDDRSVTLPNATDTLVGRNTSDTLLNKDLSSSTNTMPNKYAFHAYNNNNILNVTGHSTVYSIVLDSTLINTDSVYDTNTGIFTAPLTGVYQFHVTLSLIALSADTTYGLLELITTDRSYYLYLGNPASVRNTTDDFVVSGSVIVPMDVGDTAYLRVTVTGGADNDTVGIGGNSYGTTFSGCRIV